MGTRLRKYPAFLTGLLLLSSLTYADGAAMAPAAASPDAALTDSVCRLFAPGSPAVSDLAGLTEVLSDIPLPTTNFTPKDPIVITVPGLRFREIGWGPLEFRTFINLARHLFPDKKADAKDYETVFSDYNSRFDHLQEAATRVQDPEDSRFTPDTYLEDRLARSPACASLTMIPFPWTRDPGDTETTVDRFIPQLIGVYDTYKNTGRPIYILSHSWGAVIMHDALHRISVIRPDVKIDKFFSLGTPLMPGNAIVKLFLKLEITKEDLQKAVRKPANVRYWKNVWASRDPFSNVITAADENIRVDAPVGDPESALEDIIIYGSGHRLEAKTDLIAITNVRLWHKSYFNDYKAYLKTLNRDIDVRVFDPEVAKHLTGCAEPGQPR